jgi:hypothetical protein
LPAEVFALPSAGHDEPIAEDVLDRPMNPQSRAAGG